jgi:histidinol dehydrogenase
MEAVQMYIHTRDWEAAEVIAQNHCQEGLSQVLIARASEAAETLNYATAESLLLRAHKPEIIINHYKVLGSIFNSYEPNTNVRLLTFTPRFLFYSINLSLLHKVDPLSF